MHSSTFTCLHTSFILIEQRIIAFFVFCCTVARLPLFYLLLYIELHNFLVCFFCYSQAALLRSQKIGSPNWINRSFGWVCSMHCVLWTVCNVHAFVSNALFNNSTIWISYKHVSRDIVAIFFVVGAIKLFLTISLSFVFSIYVWMSVIRRTYD